MDERLGTKPLWNRIPSLLPTRVILSSFTVGGMDNTANGRSCDHKLVSPLKQLIAPSLVKAAATITAKPTEPIKQNELY
jgi:hypothetical protein